MKILLGICGSIAVYKTYDLVRELIKNGHQVRVVATQGALQFIKLETFRYLGVEKVYAPTDDFIPEKNNDFSYPVLHINLARWADRIVICPLSANTLATLSQGKASDLLTSVCLAAPEVHTLLVPAMNSQMYQHPLVQNNLLVLSKLAHITIVEPASGPLICGEEGVGRLPSLETLVPFIELSTLSLAKKAHVLITTGATQSALDPIRYLTNPSSGITGYHLARHYLKEGHKVKVIAGKNATPLLDHLNLLPHYQLQRVISTRDMLKAVLEQLDWTDLYISAAAINDIEFSISSEKLKKDQLPDQLPIQRAPDILSEVLKRRRPTMKVVGFAAETNLSKESLLNKWQKKPVDLLVGNPVQSGLNDPSLAAQGFGTLENEYSFVQNGELEMMTALSKGQLAAEINKRINHACASSLN